MQRNMKEHSLYLKLENELRGDILSGKLAPDAAIPSEPELCRQYALSRTTVRKAIQRLVDQNFLRKAHGSGTFVIPPAERKKLPRQLAKILVLCHTVPPDIAKMDEFDRNVCLGVEAAARLKSCVAEPAVYNVSAEKLLADYHNFRFDGLVWTRATAVEMAKAAKLSRNAIPQVMIARDVPGIPGIFFDSKQAFTEVVDFFHNIGHRRLGFIDLRSELEVFRERQDSFEKACREKNIPGQSCRVDFFRDDLIAGFIAQFKPTALLCAGLMAEYLHQALEKLKLRVPEDISLIMLSPISPQYTPDGRQAELRMPVMDMGREALHAMLNCNYQTVQHFDRIVVPGEIIVGRTVASPRQTTLKEG